MQGEDRLLTPSEAVEFLNKYRNAHITVEILRQMRLKGRVKGIQMGSRMTAYRIKDLIEADITRHDAGRPKKDKVEE